MWSPKQKALIAQARRALRLTDDDYRQDLRRICKVDTSTARQLTDRDLDRIMAYWEAIYWRTLSTQNPLNSQPQNGIKPFLKPDYWARKNTAHNTSRDRYTKAHAEHDAEHFESLLLAAGKNQAYLQTIKRNCHHDPVAYRAALAKTCKALRL